MNRQILRLAIPNIISNITIPLLGMVDMAIAGHIDEGTAIGGISIGITIFNMIYWMCGFLRMGTSGVTAQAYGAENRTECANILIRSIFVALVIALLLILFQRPIGELSFSMMKGTSDTTLSIAKEYFYARIWAAPASVSLFALNGWYIGMQNSRTPMYVAIISNVINILVSILYVFVLDWGIAGIGWATVTAQYSGLVLTWILWTRKYGHYARLADFRESIKRAPMLRFFNINKDIFLRTVCLVAAYTFFTVGSARFGDTILATNALLMQLFTLYSYMSDGFAYAAESLTGLYVGAGDKKSLKDTIKKLLYWSASLTILYVIVYLTCWWQILSLFTHTPEIIACAQEYIYWVAAIPLAGCVPFLIDGIMLGATQTKVLRNTMFIAIALFFAIFFSTVGAIGNNAIWLAFVSFIALRGILLLFATKGLNADMLMRGRELYGAKKS